MTRAASSVAMALVVAAMVVVPAEAYMEDLCIRWNATNLWYENLFEGAFKIGCKTGMNTLECQQTCAALSNTATQNADGCIGTVHLLGTYLYGLAVGLKYDLAYLLSIYASATDPAMLTLYDNCGERMANRWQVPAMYDVSRTCLASGGGLMHMPFSWNGHTGDSLHPDFTYEHEGFIRSIRDWVYQPEVADKEDPTKITYGPHAPCVYGVMKPEREGATPFEGKTCYPSDPRANITQTLPMWPWGTRTVTRDEYAKMNATEMQKVRWMTDIVSYFGDEPINIRGTTKYMMNDIATWLNSGYPEYSKRQGSHETETVPVQVAKMGIYLHYLGDRASHAYCTDLNDTGMWQVSSDGQPLAFKLGYNFTFCNFAYHSEQHFWETGHPEGNSPQTYATFRTTWSEMVAWAQEMIVRHPDWFDGNKVKNVNNGQHFIDIMDRVSEVQSAEHRIGEFLAFLKNESFPTLPMFPGHSTVCQHFGRTDAASPILVSLFLLFSSLLSLLLL